VDLPAIVYSILLSHVISDRRAAGFDFLTSAVRYILLISATISEGPGSPLSSPMDDVPLDPPPPTAPPDPPCVLSIQPTPTRPTCVMPLHFTETTIAPDTSALSHPTAPSTTAQTAVDNPARSLPQYTIGWTMNLLAWNIDVQRAVSGRPNIVSCRVVDRRAATCRRA
jgi:hypothetical protein